MDETLAGIVKGLQELTSLRLGQKPDKTGDRAAIIALLIVQELIGDVVAYIDAEGRLAWRASDQLKEWFV